MSRYVNIDQIIADIYEKWGCDPAYYVGVSGIDAYKGKLDADLIEFLQSKPSIDIVMCGECKFFNGLSCTHGLGLDCITKVSYCSFGRRKANE